jgi:hypothetical protein
MLEFLLYMVCREFVQDLPTDVKVLSIVCLEGLSGHGRAAWAKASSGSDEDPGAARGRRYGLGRIQSVRASGTHAIAAASAVSVTRSSGPRLCGAQRATAFFAGPAGAR